MHVSAILTRPLVDSIACLSIISSSKLLQTYRTPFVVNPVAYQPGLVYHNNAWKTANQMVTETNMLAGVRPITDMFPVSTGIEHKTSGVEEEDVGGAGGGASGSGGGAGTVFAQQVGVVNLWVGRWSVL